MNFSKIKQKILNKSDTYNYYKSENFILKNKLNKEINYCKNEIEKLNSNQVSDIEILNCKNEIEKLNNKQISNEEILNSYYTLLNILLIDYDLKPKGILKNMQILCQELLDFVKNICDKYELNYWLSDGNLLGAVRHGGYIPWDDDMDIGMMRKEFHEFNKVAFKEIKNNNMDDYIKLKVFPDFNETDILAFTKLDCITSDNHILASIDIFPYDYATDKNFTFDKFLEFRPKFLLKKNNYEEVLSEYYNEFNLDLDDGNYIIPNPASIRYLIKGHLIFYDKNKIFPLSKIKFNDKYYNCPNDVQYFLINSYNNFMNIPQILEYQHDNINKLRCVNNIDAYYVEFINKLKECNFKFKV